MRAHLGVNLLCMSCAVYHAYFDGPRGAGVVLRAGGSGAPIIALSLLYHAFAALCQIPALS